jgi:hypothetical protein
MLDMPLIAYSQINSAFVFKINSIDGGTERVADGRR